MPSCTQRLTTTSKPAAASVPNTCGRTEAATTNRELSNLNYSKTVTAIGLRQWRRGLGRVFRQMADISSIASSRISSVNRQQICRYDKKLFSLNTVAIVAVIFCLRNEHADFTRKSRQGLQLWWIAVICPFSTLSVESVCQIVNISLPMLNDTLKIHSLVFLDTV